MLYSISNPDRTGTAGKINIDAHVLTGAVSVGAIGNITTLTVLLTPHAPIPAVPAIELPHVAVKT